MAHLDDDQPLERLDVDNDYEGGQWIGGEFFFTAKRQKRMQTEEDRLYGVFQGSSDEEDGGRRRRGRNQSKQDLTRPVAFVSTGVAGASNDDSAAAAEAAVVQPVAAGLGSASRAGLGNGAGLGADPAQGSSRAGLGAGGGLGFAPSAPGDEDEEDFQLPGAFGKLAQRKADQRRKAQKQQEQAEKRRVAQAADPKAAQFLQNANPVASKMMQAMGWKPGEGLGANKQGLSSAIEVKLRGKNKGLGFDGQEHHMVPNKEPTDSAAAKPAGDEAGPVRLWRKKAAQQRLRREYRTAEDVLAEAAERPEAAAPKQAILDLRGPQARVVTDLQHLNVQQETQAGDAVPMPELQHNLRLLVDLAEADIQRIDARIRHEKDTAILLARDEERLREDVAQQAEQVARVHRIMSEVMRCQSVGASLALTEVERIYRGLKAGYREEYTMFNLATAVLSQVLPRLAAQLEGWQPLADPGGGARALAPWRDLLQSDAQRDAIFQDVLGAGADPWARLLAALVLPRLNPAVTNQWQARQPEPLLAFLEAWQPLLPPALEAHILDTLVWPKLAAAVEGWQPTQEVVPLHSWLHPWLPMLGSRLAELYPGIRHKLSSALQQWHPSDQSALLLLSPWHTVFEAKDWEALVSRSILPKLAWALGELLVINPRAQDPAPWQWAMAWAPVLPPALLAGLLDAHFWPRWHAVLAHWLAHSPDYDEVTRWYLGWKSLLPVELLDSERVRKQLNAALNMMNSAVDGRPAPAYQAPPPVAPAATAAPLPPQPAPPPLRAAGGLELTLRQLVEQFAEEAGVQFAPKLGRSHEGLQVYAFGGVSIIMDNAANLIRAHLGDRWVPVSLERLVAESAQRAQRRPAGA